MFKIAKWTKKKEIGEKCFCFVDKSKNSSVSKFLHFYLKFLLEERRERRESGDDGKSELHLAFVNNINERIRLNFWFNEFSFPFLSFPFFFLISNEAEL